MNADYLATLNAIINDNYASISHNQCNRIGKLTSRKVSRNHRIFQNDDSVHKVMFLAIYFSNGDASTNSCWMSEDLKPADISSSTSFSSVCLCSSFNFGNSERLGSIGALASCMRLKNLYAVVASQWHVFNRAKAANLDWQQIELMSDQELSARVRAAKEYECQLLAGSSSEPKYPNIFAHRIATAV